MDSMQKEIADITGSNMGTSDAPAPVDIPDTPPPGPAPAPRPRPPRSGGRRKISDLLGERRKWQQEQREQREEPETPEILPRSELPSIRLHAMAFNNFITVSAWTAVADDEDEVEGPVRDALMSTGKFRDVGPFYYTALDNVREAESFWQRVQKLEDRGAITIPDDIRDNVSTVIDAFSDGGKQAAIRISRTQKRDMMSFYLMANRKRGSESNIAVIYLGVEDDTLYAFIDMSRHNRTGGREIYRSVKGRGLEWVQQVQAPFATFTNKKEAWNFLKNLHRNIIEVENPAEIKDEIQALKIQAIRRRRNAPAPGDAQPEGRRSARRTAAGRERQPRPVRSPRSKPKDKPAGKTGTGKGGWSLWSRIGKNKR